MRDRSCNQSESSYRYRSEPLCGERSKASHNGTPDKTMNLETSKDKCSHWVALSKKNNVFLSLWYFTNERSIIFLQPFKYIKIQ